MRHALFCALGVAAVLVQVVLTDRLALPGGVVPDIALVLVVIVGLMQGPVTGMLTGFCAGLVLDLAPPGGYVIGGSVLVFCLLGYGCGRISRRPEGSIPRLLAAAVIAVCAGEVAEAGFALVAGDSGVTLAAVRRGLPVAALYDVLVCAVLLAAALAVRQSRGGRPLASEPSINAQFQPSTRPSFSRASFSRPSVSQPDGQVPFGRVIRPTGHAATGAVGNGADPGRGLRMANGASGTLRSAPRPDLGESALRAPPGLVAKPVWLRLRAASTGLRRQSRRPKPAKFRPNPAGQVRYRPVRLTRSRAGIGSLRLGSQSRRTSGRRARGVLSVPPGSVLGRRARTWREMLPWIGGRSARRGGMSGLGGQR
ncbi:MAG TPA: rod shape-determining protein MreD [Streptosporangiaceae bacterium]|jgi:rod shape-determining protein MreD|nr:rod shape-determining protein MreD [Streptosporangiaceae bacterium]